MDFSPVLSALGSIFSGNSRASQLRTEGDLALQSAQLDQQQQNRQGDVADLGAQQDLNNAEQARAEAGVMATEALMQGRAAVASGAVRAAAGGGGLAGSSMGVLANLANMAMFNARVQAYRGITASQSDTGQAALDSYQAEMDRWGGQVSLYKGKQQKALNEAGAQAAQIGGYIGAASKIVNAVGQAFTGMPAGGSASSFSGASGMTGAGDLTNFA